MKKYFKILKAFIALTFLFSIHTVSFSQPPPPPPLPPGGGHGSGGNQPGGAPVGEGVFLLIGLAGLYGGKKVYDIRKSLHTED